MSDKNIIVIRATKHISKQELNACHKLWQTQLKDGIVVIPDDFEFVSLDPDTLKPCEIGWEQIKKESWWSTLLRRIKGGA